ncbi:MAG: hypothetical protein KDA80_17645 [Planctomycetaceae bacterium]|nr:hypothetical protein [Planctomycetaceae bacterium]
MSHSHLVIRHLIRQLEKSPERPARPVLPDWLVDFIHSLTENFEPFSGVARVGYEAQQADDGWELAMFLGETEIVGGAEDGERSPVNFRFSLTDLHDRFDRVEHIYWNAFPNSHVCLDNSGDLSFLSVEGVLAGERIRLQIHPSAPDAVGPAIRQHQDGRLELVE